MKDLSKEEIKRLINRENPIILDIGCYDGKDSKEIAAQFENCIIHCFDADPRSQKLFNKLNAGNKKLNLWKMAICAANGQIEFNLSDSKTRRHYDFQDSWSASSSIAKPKFHKELFPDVHFRKKITVPCMKLDSWYSQILKGKIIDFIWADVNGAEEDLVIGGLNTIQNQTRFLYIEVSDKEFYEGEIKKDDFLKLLPDFEVLGTYKDEGNFCNILLKNNAF